jgi:hypothetical protein
MSSIWMQISTMSWAAMPNILLRLVKGTAGTHSECPPKQALRAGRASKRPFRNPLARLLQGPFLVFVLALFSLDRAHCRTHAASTAIATETSSKQAQKAEKKRSRTQPQPEKPPVINLVDSSDEATTPVSRGGLRQGLHKTAKRAKAESDHPDGDEERAQHQEVEKASLVAKRAKVDPDFLDSEAVSVEKRPKLESESLLPELEDARQGLEQDRQLFALLSKGGKPTEHVEVAAAAADPASTGKVDREHAKAVSAASSTGARRFVLTCSGLRTKALELVKQHCIAMRAQMEPGWSSTVTHVVMAVPEDGRCKRTVKYLQG